MSSIIEIDCDKYVYRYSLDGDTHKSNHMYVKNVDIINIKWVNPFNIYKFIDDEKEVVYSNIFEIINKITVVIWDKISNLLKLNIYVKMNFYDVNIKSIFNTNDKIDIMNNIINYIDNKVKETIGKICVDNLKEIDCNHIISKINENTNIKYNKPFIVNGIRYYCAYREHNESMYIIGKNNININKDFSINYLKKSLENGYYKSLIVLGDYYNKNELYSETFKLYESYIYKIPQTDPDYDNIVCEHIKNYYNNINIPKNSHIENSKLINLIFKLPVQKYNIYNSLYNIYFGTYDIDYEDDGNENKQQNQIELLKSYISDLTFYNDNDNSDLIMQFIKCCKKEKKLSNDELFKYYVKASEMNNIEALLFLAEYYSDEDRDESLKYYKKLAKLNNITGIHFLIDNSNDTYEYLEKGVDMDDYFSIINMARFFNNEEPNYEFMEYCYIKAYYIKNDINDIIEMADIYNKIKCYDKSIFYYNFSINKGSINSIYNLVLHYHKINDINTTLRYCELGIEKQSLECIDFLGDYYVKQESYDKALECYTKLIEHNSFIGYYKIGNIYKIKNDEKLMLDYYSLYILNHYEIYKFEENYKNYDLFLLLEKIKINNPNTTSYIKQFYNNSKTYKKYEYCNENKFICDEECIICYNTHANDGIHHVKLYCEHKVCVNCYVKIDKCPYKCIKN